MNIVAKNLGEFKPALTFVISFFNRYIGSSLLKRCGINKICDSTAASAAVDYDYIKTPLSDLLATSEPKPRQKRGIGISAKQIFIDKIVIGFLCESFYQMSKAGTSFINCGKDTFYRFDRIRGANWERLQLETGRNVISDLESRTTDAHHRALIIDDSLYNRTGGKGTDFVGKVFDHNDHKLRIGYRMMTLGWTNSELFIPLRQALLTTRDEKLKVGKFEEPDHRTLSFRRLQTALSKGTEVMVQMVKDVQNQGIPFDYVLFDTRFSSPAQLLDLDSIGAKVIAMAKKNSARYVYVNDDGEELLLNVKQIYNANKKRRGRSKYLLSVPVTILSKDGRTKMKAKLVFARNHSNKKDWVRFVCTDRDLDEESILEIYCLRWKIEACFKTCKSLLKLRTECHSTSYDAITSHMVIVSIRYMILAISKFDNTDDRSLKDIMEGIKREVVSDALLKQCNIFANFIFEFVKDYFRLTEEGYKQFVNEFIHRLPSGWDFWVHAIATA